MFTLTQDQTDRVGGWLETVVLPEVRKKNPDLYYGAIGGELTYSFTPTSLGVIVKVKHAYGMEIDVTEYDDW